MIKKNIKIIPIFVIFVLLIGLCGSLQLVANAATPTDILYDNGIYRIRNVRTGLYLTVYNGTDANGTNVIQQTYSATNKAQQWRLSFGVRLGYYWYSMASNNGYGRVLDINRGSSAVTNGQNVQIWTPTDPTAQRWDIFYGSTSMSAKFCPKANLDVAVTVYGTGNGSSGTTTTSTGNVFMKTDATTDTFQEWYLEYVGQAPTTPNNTIAQMKQKFPDGKFWNHGTAANNPNGYTSIQCAVHGSCGPPYDGSCGCNSFETSIQCLGYVKKVTNDVYGKSYTIGTGNWLTTSENDAKNYVHPGDVVYKDNHAMVILSVTDTTFTVAECNWSSTARCRIDWGKRTFTKSTYTFSWIAKSAYRWY